MKGPSLDAIKRFKAQQDIKKREEEERKIKEKLITLEHRASQGDRKAKQNLKRIEQIKSESKSAPDVAKPVFEQAPNVPKSQKHVVQKPNKVVTDFEELMKLARGNNNEIRKENPKILRQPSPIQEPSTSIKKADQSQFMKREKSNNIKPSQIPATLVKKADAPKVARGMDPKKSTRTPHTNQRLQYNNVPRPVRFQDSRAVRDDEYEDEYEQDDFVVDDDDEDVQDELRQTLRSVFRYDRRRCDLREQELDRQYKEIGKVSTFEDLEREERRATRLAQIEDAKSLREEEERKRLKKIRLKRK